jgi:hypothetical protein
MADFTEKRPTSVSVIGWFWIIVGSFMAFSGIVASLASIFQRPRGFPRDTNAGFGVFDFVFGHFVFFAIAQVLVGAVAITAGAHFLRLRAWARTMLEVIAWLGLVNVIGWIVVLQFDAISHGGERGAFHSIVRIVMGIMLMAFYGVPLGVIVHFLRSPKVRGAMRQ